MRILQLVEHLLPGGTERMAVNISNVLDEEGHYVVLCTTRQKGALEKLVNKDILQVCLNKKSTIDIIAFIRLLRTIRSNKIELIHAHSSSVYWAIAAKMLIPEIRIIWHDHYGLSENIKDNSRTIIRLLSRFISAIIAVNDNLRQWSIRNTKIDQDRILLINNFPYAVKNHKSTVPGVTTIVCLANLRPQKDHSTCIEAINIIKKEFPEINLEVIFAGLYWHDDYFFRLKRLIEEYNLSDTIKIIGSVENSEELLSSADIGVLSSMSEGLPVSLLEYGLAALPVVVTDVGQCSEVVGNGSYGKVVKSGDFKAMARALAEYLSDNKAAENVGIRFRQHVIENYGPGNFLEKYSVLLKKIMNND